MRSTRLVPLAAMVAMTTALAAGCATKTVAPPPVDTAPLASSPTNAVRRFEWAMNHKSAETIRDMLTDDFVLISAGIDSAGNPSRDTLGGRSWFLDALAALEDSSASVSMILDRNLFAFGDTRPGKDPRVHKQIRSSLDLRVRLPGPEGAFEVTGNLLVFVVRGDSAAIPPEQVARGVKPDSTRWWFERMEDETLGGSARPAATQPQFVWTFGRLLAYFYSLVAH